MTENDRSEGPSWVVAGVTLLSCLLWIVAVYLYSRYEAFGTIG